MVDQPARMTAGKLETRRAVERQLRGPREFHSMMLGYCGTGYCGTWVLWNPLHPS